MISPYTISLSPLSNTVVFPFFSTSTNCFSSGEDSATKHRVHEWVHPPGRHGDDGRKPPVDGACCLVSCLGHLLHHHHPPANSPSSYPPSIRCNEPQYATYLKCSNLKYILVE